MESKISFYFEIKYRDISLGETFPGKRVAVLLWIWDGVDTISRTLFAEKAFMSLFFIPFVPRNSKLYEYLFNWRINRIKRRMIHKYYSSNKYERRLTALCSKVSGSYTSLNYMRDNKK